ncbi:UTP--hexose-1-phosphate uridylyltransferase [Corynebacterium sp. CMW7794]|uniref:Galactose-1-phosphate uridylyltransferase n=1 Tax=Corynebacterium phoceense TaxID=1686286 RepID=A0A540R4K6_9CORY|nr:MULTISPECIES: galactose-1-phosphate uridylyltransferase [Corynebacterium]KXB53424.1 UTP--hexose-1-phosphate uridylyltransferase [Corynebacterium sp. DNF00584]KXI17409.1 UTP--hexose-1-phosphate uridylyltransferase [Corynebacterium sp. CMW7794]OFL76648.1 galactose-1-phosphate uridylyltransferase [Corynebacterium sp. HMSC077B05]OFN42342.1 galactose-1-phosphate uridylyltransferase [Corynebacterium sp. HMSC072G08]OFP20001.1 galactose-1-phosphate uridylyltransferase [Corynebacterium sp. HMSC065A0
MVDIQRTKLADGRDLIYFDEQPHPDRVLEDPRDLPQVHPASEMRRDPLTGEWVAYAAHRMNRTFMPPANENPLAPSTSGNLPTEIPSPSYDVVVFENRFPSFALNVDDVADNDVDGMGLVPRYPAKARCEVVCFTSDPTKSFRDLPVSRIRTVIEVWAHRTAELSQIPEVKQVFPFENRGAEIGVTLQHPHGQIYSYPFYSPRLANLVARSKEYKAEHNADLFQTMLDKEREAGTRVIATTEHFTVFVPAAAKWPLEVMVMPNVHVPNFAELSEAQRDDLAVVLKKLYTAVDQFFEGVEKTPYIAGWNQAPTDDSDAVRMHLQLFSLMRSPNRMKFLAGSESSQAVWINDTTPERIAEKFKELWNDDLV